MHLLYLGTCKDLYPSALGYWIRTDVYGNGPLAKRLRKFSEDLRVTSRQQKFPDQHKESCLIVLDFLSVFVECREIRVETMSGIHKYC